MGDQHGYFRRLWSWDLSEEQLNSMEAIARQNSKHILRLLLAHGSDPQARDNSGTTVLGRASAVENFAEVIRFLVEAGCRVNHNILNWTRIKNPDCVSFIQRELVNPKSLLRQARLQEWKLTKVSGYTSKITKFWTPTYLHRNNQ